MIIKDLRLKLTLTLSLVVFSVNVAAQNYDSNIERLAREVESQVIDWRHWFHQLPMHTHTLGLCHMVDLCSTSLQSPTGQYKRILVRYVNPWRCFGHQRWLLVCGCFVTLTPL